VSASIETVPAVSSPITTSSPLQSIIKAAAAAPLSPKRRVSTASVGQLLPNRRSLQMTALATKRQNLWMNIAKNAQGNNIQSSSIPMRQQTQQSNLLRKKLLRLLLVFSYLLSISLFAIALATFYGFFWSGYSTSQTATPMSPMEITIVSSASLTKNSTLFDIGFPLDETSRDGEQQN
jgi:hypothetical protein